MPVHFADSTRPSSAAHVRPLFKPSQQQVTYVTAEEVRNMTDFRGELSWSEKDGTYLPREQGSTCNSPQQPDIFGDSFRPNSSVLTGWQNRSDLPAYTAATNALKELGMMYDLWRHPFSIEGEPFAATHLAAAQKSYNDSMADLKRHQGGRIFAQQIIEESFSTHEEVEKYCQANTSEGQSGCQSNGAE